MVKCIHQIDSVEVFERLLPLFSKNLEKVNFCEDGDRSLVDVLTKTVCPRLREIDLMNLRINEDVFEKLLANLSNLRKLTWKINSRLILLKPDRIYENLEKLIIHYGTENFFSVMTGHCPNLECVAIHHSQRITVPCMENFFASCPKMKTVIIQGDLGKSIKEIDNFWKLKNLRVLIFDFGWTISNEVDSENLFQKIASSFPQLEELFVIKPRATKRGVAALTSLKNLRHLVLDIMEDGFSEVLRLRFEKTFSCNLKKLQINCAIPAALLMNIVRFNTELEFLKIANVKDIDTAGDAALVAHYMSKHCKRNLEIQMLPVWNNRINLWKSVEIDSIFEKMKVEKGWTISIKFEFQFNTKYDL